MSPAGDGAGIPFALLSPPTVQTVRFLSKVVLVWFLSADELGASMLAGLLAFLGLHVALFGLDEAAIYARELGPGLWRRMRRFHHLSGVLVSLLLAASGQLLGRLQGDPLLGALITALAPSVWLANLSVLPTALLVRHRRYRAIFMVDVWSVGGFATTTIALAALGAGPWSLIGGWYANALLSAIAAGRLARALRPTGDEPVAAPRPAPGTVSGAAPGAAFAPTLRYGAHMTGANLLGFAGERVDSFAVGFGLGRAALGLYEWALHLSLFTFNFATSLAERVLFPILAEHHRQDAMGPSFREALRLCTLVILPLHLLLAVLAGPLITSVFPAEWHAAAPLLALLSLAAGARCFDLLGTTALKAAGRSRTVLRLAALRIALLCAALPVGLVLGLHALAVGVLAARVLGAVALLVAASRLPGVGVRLRPSAERPAP